MLLQAALANKDAEIASLRAERDAALAHNSSLRKCITHLNAAVDQLVVLCHAQVADLSLLPSATSSEPTKSDDDQTPPSMEDTSPTDETDEREQESIEDTNDESNSEERDHPRKRKAPHNTFTEDVQEEEILSEECVAVWADSEEDQMPMEKFIVDAKGAARLPIQARVASEFVESRNGECMIREKAFAVEDKELPGTLQVTTGPEEGHWGVTCFVNVEYPDRTRLPFVPICGVTLRGREEGERAVDLLEEKEYGVDFVHVVIEENLFHLVMDSAIDALIGEWPDSKVQKAWRRCPGGIEFAASFAGSPSVWYREMIDCKVLDVLENGDVTGDVTLMVKFIDRYGMAEVEFVIHRLQVRDTPEMSSDGD